MVVSLLVGYGLDGSFLVRFLGFAFDCGYLVACVSCGL